MNTPILIEGTIPLRRSRRTHGTKPKDAGTSTTASLSSSRIPRIARLMAMARHIDELARSGSVCSYAAAARLGHVSRARMSQIMGLLSLAPDLQEQLLFLDQSGYIRSSLSIANRHGLGSGYTLRRPRAGQPKS